MRRVFLLPILLPLVAWAGESEPLDLKPAERPMFADGATTPYRNDPPGTYYGDTSGVPGKTAASLCPTAPDGSARSVTGSATTGMGWSSRGGNSRYNALDLNFCKEGTSESGKPRVFNASIHIGQLDVGGGERWGGRGHGGPPPRGRR